MTERTIGAAFLAEALLTLRKQKTLADRAMAQVDDPALFRALDAEANSIAVIVRHVAGNQRSRWTDFLTSDGEKADRNRDGEFEAPPIATREAVLGEWEAGWALVFAAIEPLRADDLERVITIRGEPHTVLQAIQRQIAHYAQHVGQIVLLAKHQAGAGWKSLSIPRGKSKEFEVARDGSRITDCGSPYVPAINSQSSWSSVSNASGCRMNAS